MSDVQYVANRFMPDPVIVRVGSLDLATVHTVTQNIVVCEDDQKLDLVI